MKQDIQNIVEGNKAISKFMEYEQHGRQEWEYTYWMIEGKSYREDELKYHSSWDWLHEAWEKFRGLKISEVDEGFRDYYSRHLEAVGVAIVHYSIAKAFERLVTAIQWYNNQQKQVKE